MTHTPHELASDFPEHAERISTLRQTDAHFARLAEEYHTINRAVHRAETNIEPASDLDIIEMRKERMALKDRIYAALNAPA
ncbi:MAG: YdcH family protein [Pseudomonadota bacterium]